MKTRFFYLLCLTVILLSISINQGFSQVKNVNIKKVNCKNEITKSIGYKLVVEVSSGMITGCFRG